MRFRMGGLGRLGVVHMTSIIPRRTSDKHELFGQSCRLLEDIECADDFLDAGAQFVVNGNYEVTG